MAKLDYKKMNLDDIERWCIDNGEIEWLLAEEKNPKFTFIKTKMNFCRKFMPDIIPEKKVVVSKKADSIARLEKLLAAK